MHQGVKVFVGNVPEETSQVELRDLFEAAAEPGEVLKVALMKQFAFVHMRDDAAADRAIGKLNGHLLHGHRVVVEHSRPRPTHTVKVFVGNVSAACTSGELRVLFQEFGPVVECDIVKGNDDAEWEPPSEAELKVIQARRERQDKISKLMSEYLLKGYRMLGDCCEDCGTILLQDKQKKLYCVACQELNSDVDKDNPALNAQAALSQVRERQLAANSEDISSPGSLSSLPTPRHVPRPEHCEGAASGLRASAPTPALPAPVAPPASPPPVSALTVAEEAILQKISWAGHELQQSTSIETSIQLCSLIRSCTESLKGIKELQQ
ncbi:protein ZNRD2 isoform X2 [Elgaria multicarinata webbii]|uniref:protein ZNRD2 isoform X2 n=1 Tax=Elgaria multicarinata webbii TaxID=159646 RepID=UPI002FCCF571